jgi:hypothetical protein
MTSIFEVIPSFDVPIKGTQNCDQDGGETTMNKDLGVINVNVQDGMNVAPLIKEGKACSVSGGIPRLTMLGDARASDDHQEGVGCTTIQVTEHDGNQEDCQLCG